MIQRQLAAKFVYTANHGELPKSKTAPSSGNSPLSKKLKPVPDEFFLKAFGEKMLGLEKYPGVGYADQPKGEPADPNTGFHSDVPMQRMMAAFGSTPYCFPFMALEREVNEAKGRLMKEVRPVAEDHIDGLARQAAKSGTKLDADQLLNNIRMVGSVKVI